jgi:hypothetical protein
MQPQKEQDYQHAKQNVANGFQELNGKRLWRVGQPVFHGVILADARGGTGSGVGS